jgi:hypothetical protein
MFLNDWRLKVMKMVKPGLKEDLLKNGAGQAIVEAVVALATILVILSAITVAVLTSISNSDFIKKQTLAKKYAEQGMEYIRYSRNNTPGGGLTPTPGAFFDFSSGGTYCMNKEDQIPVFETGACGAVNIDNYFKREMTIHHNDSQCGGGGSKVTIRVSWTSTKCTSDDFCHASELVSCFPTIPDSLKTL